VLGQLPVGPPGGGAGNAFISALAKSKTRAEEPLSPLSPAIAASPSMSKVMGLLGGKKGGEKTIIRKKFKKEAERKIDPEAMVEGFPGVRGRDIKTAFDAIDVDRSGYLACQEIRHFLALCGQEATDPEIDEMIRMLDGDGNGRVGFVEFFDSINTPTHRIARELHASSPLIKVDTKAGGKVTRQRQENLAKMMLGGIEHQMQKSNQARLAAIELGTGSRGSRLAAENRRQHMEAAGGGGDAEVVDMVLAAKEAGLGKVNSSFVKKVRQRFRSVDVDGSGTISYPEFCKVIEPPDTPQLKRMFEIFDSDGSGFVDSKEFLVGISGYTGSSKEDRLKFCFMIFDEDSSGFIEMPELVKILRGNFISERTESTELEKRAEGIIKTAGPTAVRDKRLTFEEFVKVAQLQPGLIFPAQQLIDKLNKTMKAGGTDAGNLGESLR
jgi:Ca2+-binding EF-hand superfamily protein